MKLGKNVKIIFILFVIILIAVPSFNFVLGAINEDYTVPESTTSSTGKISDNLIVAFLVEKITSALTKLVFFFGQVLEWLLGIVSLIVSKQQIVPWADMIIFNAVPMLDVNFMNPASGSLIEAMQGLIRNLYFSILSIAIAFFGVAVLVMAVKLLTTAIASEKAKYKEAIMNWVVGLGLLFTIHYFIAFVFFLNENMVKVASTIATQSIEGKMKIDSSTGNDILKNLKVFCEEAKNRAFWENFYGPTSILKAFAASIWADKEGTELSNTLDSDKAMEDTVLKMLEDNASFRANLFNYTGEGWSYYINWLKTVTVFNLNKMFYNDGMGETVISINEFTKAVKVDAQKVSSDENYWINKFLKGKITDEELTTAVNGYSAKMQAALKEKIAFKVSTNISKDNIKQYCNYVKYYNSEDKVNKEGGGNSAIANLANYFKYSTIQCEEGAIIATKMKPENAIMYVIFIAQSVLYFLTYVKRFFYVIALALMAPIIVVYDFFTKSIA